MINAEESFDLNLGSGDISDHSTRPEFELAQATFALSKKPGHAVRDNHDLNEGLCAESSMRLSRDTPPVHARSNAHGAGSLRPHARHLRLVRPLASACLT